MKAVPKDVADKEILQRTKSNTDKLRLDKLRFREKIEDGPFNGLVTNTDFNTKIEEVKKISWW